jgi:peptidoglycan/LPS O-acetylase OafA/YrhL
MNRVSTEFITVLRGISILFVLLAHLRVLLSGLDYELLDFLGELGKYGVVCFFVISGFTIAFQLEHLKYNHLLFIFFRILRISVVFIPLSIIYLCFFFVLNGEFNLPAIHYWLYLSWFFPGQSNSLIGVEWTLDVEIFSYLAFFGLSVYFSFQSKNFLYRVLGLLVITFFVLILILIFKEKLPYFLSSIYSPFRYFFYFVLGFLSFYVKKKYNRDSQHFTFLLMLMMSLATLINYLNYSSHLGVFLFSLVVFYILVSITGKGYTENTLIGRFFYSPIRVLGVYSFSLYLVHYPVFKYFGSLEPSLYTYLLFFAFLGVGVYLSYELLEKKLYFHYKCKLGKYR